ncbi:MAG TPA: DUF1501 domain-containing protein [Kofleriaceae bacterium]|nr:DUF1501 domain-containing protein [Kofleriaceae bacterium]
MSIRIPGGIDAVLTTNPRRSNELSSAVDRPFGDADVFEEAGNRFGPHMAPLKGWLDRLTILNNVRTETVSHPGGRQQHARLRIGAPSEAPLITEIVGAHLGTGAIPSVALGLAGHMSPRTLNCTGAQMRGGPTLCDDFAELSSAELLRGAEILERTAQRSTGSQREVQNTREVARYMRKLAGSPAFTFEQWAEETAPEDLMVMGIPLTLPLQKQLQQTVWMLENEITSTVLLNVQAMDWDSHFDNLSTQTKHNAVFFPLLARFFEQLATRRNAHGTLADNTVVVLMSELGRHPYLNASHGKDHLPEAPLIMFGKPFKPGVYGATGREMEALPVDPATGQLAKNGRMVRLDDIGVTILDAFGIDPLTYGYQGRPVEFLRSAS